MKLKTYTTSIFDFKFNLNSILNSKSYFNSKSCLIRYYTRRIWGVTERELDALSVTGKDISFQNGLYVHVWNSMSLGRSKPRLFCRSGTALNCQSGTILNCHSENQSQTKMSEPHLSRINIVSK